MSAERYFDAHPSVLRIAPSLFRRGAVLAARELRCYLALLAHATALPASAKSFSRGAFGEPVVAFMLRRAEILRLQSVTSDASSGPKADPSAAAWRAQKAALEALQANDVAFDLTVRRRHGRIERVTYDGPLIGIDDVTVKVHCCAAPGYFVAAPNALFGLALNGFDLGLLCWLLARHRGRRVNGHVQHNWRLTLPEEELRDVGFGTTARTAHRRVTDALSRLAELGVLDTVSDANATLEVALSRSFFHVESADA